MIEYHEERMSTVNKIMKKLWKHVYKGTDTSSIEICTEPTEGVGSNRRSYNYKLIQTKHGCKMDMKGRCSAGQKVIHIGQLVYIIMKCVILIYEFFTGIGIDNYKTRFSRNILQELRHSRVRRTNDKFGRRKCEQLSGYAN